MNRKTLKIILFLVLLSILIQELSAKSVKDDETDYYKIMGLKRDATEDQIKKAFKKLAVRYHPDKNQDNPEAAKLKFQKIANAYETLSDPEKRRIYDQLGEEGVKRQAQGGGQSAGNAEDIFKHFFQQGSQGGSGQQGGRRTTFNFGNMGGNQGSGGGFDFGGFGGFEDILKGFAGGFGGGGQGFGGKQQGGGKQRQQQQQKPANTEDLFPSGSDQNIIKIDSKMAQSIRNRNKSDIWLILFYKRETFEKKYVATLKSLAQKMKDIIKVGVADCSVSGQICKDFGVVASQRHAIKIFTENSGNHGENLDQKANLEDWKALADLALKHYDSLLTPIYTFKQYENFLSKHPEKTLVLILTNKTTESPLFKALAKNLKTKVLFGDIKLSDSLQSTSIFQHHHLTPSSDQSPHLLFVAPNGQVIQYTTRDFTYESMTSFLDKLITQTQKKSNEVKVLNKQSYEVDHLCHPQSKSTDVCIIALNQKEARQMKEKLKQYEGKPIKLVEVQQGQQIDGVKSSNDYMALKPKRQRYSVMPQQTGFNLDKFIDEVLIGGTSIQWQPLGGPLVFKKAQSKEEL